MEVQSKEIKEFLGSRIPLTLRYNKTDMAFFPKSIQTFEIQRKGIDMKTWVKDKFKDGKHLILINYIELENERFTLISERRISRFYNGHYAEIKGEINGNQLIFEIRMSMTAELGLWIGGIIVIIFSIGLVEEGNYMIPIILWGVFLFMSAINYFLVKYEIKHLDKLLQEEMKFT